LTKWFLAIYAAVLCCIAPFRPLWLDEVLQLSDTYHHTMHQTIDRVAHNPGGVPLSYILQSVFVNGLGHPFYSARLLSILFAVTGMAAFIWLARLLQIPWFPVSLCYALLPISLRYALEIRQYGPALAFSILATALLIWLDDLPNPVRAASYGFVLVLGLYTHPYLGFVILAHMLWSLHRFSVRYVLAACASSLLLFLPWYLYARTFWSQAIVKGGYPSVFGWKTLLMIPHELSGGGYFLTCAMFALAAFGYRQTPCKDLLLLTILVPLPLVILGDIWFRYFFAIRQLVFIVPPLCIFAVQGLRRSFVSDTFVTMGVKRWLLSFAFLLPTMTFAQDKTHFVRATGEATVSAHPDRAQISIGVLTQASTAQAAATANATQTTQVIDAIKKTLGESGELKTTGYSISPQYQYTTGRSPKITGYQASNTVLIVVNELSLLGKVIDAASDSGANNINGVSFSLKDETHARNQALAEAASKARAAAESIAKALNVHVVGVLQAETAQTPTFRPLNRSFAAMAAPQAMPTPIEPGDLDIQATVTVTLEVQ